ncbi:acyltransferase [Olivibacter sp. SDN3]|uniref:acyltransferase family protein n=1 Tax=Olivibacter sp. SDN3 TaxID=2764720 RepID=UPI0016512777|nr:acyltransferase [Olivibacter sp. SDN3]QNL49604.1 acyltransferase [Olivibacter sp. SDN3]
MRYLSKLLDFEGKHLAGLDHLRALAIILVFLCHYRAYERPEWVEVIGSFGWVGVDLFFVLSGYLIGYQLLRYLQLNQVIDFKHFYISRTLRILPAYFLVVTLYFMFPVLRERGGIAPFWQFITFTQNFNLDFGNEGSFSHAWSLCIEEQFYLLLPLTLTLIAQKGYLNKGMYILLFLFAASMVVRAISWYYFMAPFYFHDILDGRFVAYNKWVYYPTYNRLDGLLVGVGIAALMVFRPGLRDRLAAYGNQLFFAGCAVIIVAYFFLSKDRLDLLPTLFGYPLIAVGFGLMVLGALYPTCFLYHLRWKISTLIAALSYGIYLCHKFLNHLLQGPLQELGIPAESNWRLLICAIVSVLGALLMHRFIEYPFLQWRNVLLRRRRTIRKVKEAWSSK